MKIVLATGIYPPEIGGPATYCRALAKELTELGHEVVVVTYARKFQIPNFKFQIHAVSNAIPILRWFLYTSRLRNVGKDADIIYAFSSVSCGVPIILSRLKKPKRILRLGGDFAWERYTDRGGEESLKEFYVNDQWSMVNGLMSFILSKFDHIVFSTQFQQKMYEEHYKKLPEHSVIENALEIKNSKFQIPNSNRPHTPFRLLFMGRLVKFKNVSTLIAALKEIPNCVLAIVGQGPLDDALRRKVEEKGLHTRVQFVAPVSGKEKEEIFAAHDLLILPSLTEISPNTALEASASGLPVLLTKENGLSEELRKGMQITDLSSTEKIVEAVQGVREKRSPLQVNESNTVYERSWATVAEEHIKLLSD